ncbi:16S rRNA methyltransferase [Salinimonas iocasae]|uniref:Ribosomal RNA small subunit methyltransferase J n=2 Tax=Salinimonas iocasae TaxID=2572577 RepID=A0A5B7YBT2_9ALTE|nr:class I SAM-dependent methyltransferase [Salinimonas iocasae]QCZ92079.1 16S rRNA methyltransferase [Salinimonas iocasae]
MPDAVPFWVSTDASPRDRKLAQAMATQWNLPLAATLPDGLMLVIENNLLQLKDNEKPRQQGIYVDFLAGDIQYRRQHGGGKKEPIAKAVGVKGQNVPTVVDATPGLGRDAYVLASLGCKVIMVERSAVVAALLEDGLRRLAESEPALAGQLSLVHGNSIEVMAGWTAPDIDVVYLDPMFPHRKKAAAVKKEMKVFQQLLGDDPDSDQLLAPARRLARKRVIVKRPNSAAYLADTAPSMAIASKKHRFDVYIK